MLNIINIDDDKWDEIVSSFKEYDVYYLSGYVRAFKIHGDGEPLLFYYNDDLCRGINVVMKRDIAMDPHFLGKIEQEVFYDFATPYGYGGWIIEGDNTIGLFAEYEKWCEMNNIVSEFVRFHPVINNYKYVQNHYDVVSLGETVSIDLSDKDAIWENFSSKNRNVIRKAINNNVVIKYDLSKNLINEFKHIYEATMKKDNAISYYYFEDEFYDSILNDLKNNALIFYAEYENKIIATSIITWANNRLNYHLSGSLREYQHLAPSNLLLWKAAEWGFYNGCKSFHLGGGVGSSEDSLFKFKKAFYKGQLCRYRIGKKIFNHDLYNKLININNTDKDNFFPKYRG